MLTVKDKASGLTYGTFMGLTSSRVHAPMKMGITVVMFRDEDGIPWELPLSEVSLALHRLERVLFTAGQEGA